MKKGLFLFKTNPLLYLAEIPAIALLCIAIAYNGTVDVVFRLYPLIIAMIAAIIFIFVFLFRAVYLRYDEIKDIGPFTNRDKVIIKKDNTLVLKKEKRSRVKIELFGDHGLEPIYSWTKHGAREDIRLFRGAAIGGISTIKKILLYLGVEKSDFDSILHSESFTKEYESLLLTSETANGELKISVKFTETI